jgi:hypothetical protein
LAIRNPPEIKIEMVGSVLNERAFQVIRTFLTPRVKVSTPVFGSIIAVHRYVF